MKAVMDAGNCQRLWQAVLVQVLRDAIRPQGSGMTIGLDTWSARAWIGTRDFRIVCELAGVPSEDVEAYARRALSSVAPARAGRLGRAGVAA